MKDGRAEGTKTKDGRTEGRKEEAEREKKEKTM
jgi:hypothetical protein